MATFQIGGDKVMSWFPANKLGHVTRCLFRKTNPLKIGDSMMLKLINTGGQNNV